MPSYYYRQHETYDPPEWIVSRVVVVNTPTRMTNGKGWPEVEVPGINDALLWCEENCTGQWRWVHPACVMEFEKDDDAAYFLMVLK